MGFCEQQFEVTIPSDVGAGQAVQERIVRLLEELNYPSRDVFGVRLALEEALANAMKHGNGMDPNKTVRVGCQIGREKLRIEIEDEGHGFALNDVPDPTVEENLDKPSGRGIMLMQAFLTLVEYNDVGNCVILEKRRGPDSDNHKPNAGQAK